MFSEELCRTKSYVYIVSSRSRTLYIGITNDLDRRMFEHKNGVFEGFSKDYCCTRLVYYERFDGPIAAIAREKQLKGWRREKKIALIEKVNSTWVDFAEGLGKAVEPYRWKWHEHVALHEAYERVRKKAGPSAALRSAQDDDL